MTDPIDLLSQLPTEDVRDLGPQDVDALREYLNRDLFAFAWVIFNYSTLLVPDVHGPICRFIERWGGEGYRRLMVQVPRDIGKTSLVTRANSLWRICRNPDDTVAIFNEKESNAIKWLRAIREIVESNKVFQALYRDLLPPGLVEGSIARRWKWNDVELQFQRNRIVPEASITALGVTAATTGGHWTHIIKDDILSFEAARSPTVMQMIRDWVDAARNLESPADMGCDLFVCTPWGYDDAYAYVLRKWGNEYKLYRRGALENGESIIPSKWTTAKLLRMQELDPYNFNCTPAETPITLTSGQTIPIADVVVGDTVVGMELNNGRRHLAPARVLEVGTHTAEVFEYALSDGEVVRCTEDHQWLRNKRGYGPIVRWAGNKGSGGHNTRLGRIHSTEPCKDQFDAAWLGGFYDGDGSHSGRPKGRDSGGFISFAQSYRVNLTVCQHLETVLNKLGFKWERHNNTTAGLYLYRLAGGYDVRFRFLQWCKPAKCAPIIRSLFSGRAIRNWPTVVSRKSLGVQPVYWMKTETGNYIAWGCVSKNSQYLCRPMAGRDMSFQRDWLRWATQQGDKLVIEPASYSADAKVPEVEDTPTKSVQLDELHKILLVDPAPSENAELKREPGSRNALCMTGIDCYGRKYLLDLWVGRKDPADVITQMFAMCREWGCDTIAIEKVVFSVLYKHWIQARASQSGQYVRCLDLEPNRRAKDMRINALIPAFKQGLVYLNRTSPSVTEFVQEYVEYPHGGTRDILDAFAYGDDVLRRPESASEQHERMLAEQYGRRNRDKVTGY